MFVRAQEASAISAELFAPSLVNMRMTGGTDSS